jgi:GST-like protein
MFQMASVGPMFGQAAHFTYYAKDKHLAECEWFAGEEYSIADMAILSWVGGAVDNPALSARNNLSTWAKRLKARPAVERGLVGLNDEHRSQLFGEAQHERSG